MPLTNQFPDRGRIGPTPAVTTREDEAYLDYLKDLRGELLWGRSKAIHPKANAAIRDANIDVEPTHESVEAVREVIQSVPEAGVWARVYRSTQDMFWTRVAESYGLKEADFLRMLDESDQKGPGSVTWDPSYEYPTYANVETHRQRGGYVGHPLAGLIFDYGTRVFSGNSAPEDTTHESLMQRVVEPLDGKVERIMDIGCSIGQLTCQLKRKYPKAEVWGSDISAPMVRYAHHRAVQQGLDVHFLQKAAEDLDDLPENQFDLVTCYILFHEVPTPVVDRTIENVFRMLRPGGTFWFSDFPSLSNDKATLKYTDFLGTVDSADNNEPYAPEFVRSNIEQKLQAVGFTLRAIDDDIRGFVRVCDKPA